MAHCILIFFVGCTSQGELLMSLPSTGSQPGQCRVQVNSQDWEVQNLCWCYMAMCPGHQERWELRKWIPSVKVTSLWKGFKGFKVKLKVESLIPACPRSELSLRAALRLLSVLHLSSSINVGLGRHFRRDPPQCFALSMWSCHCSLWEPSMSSKLDASLLNQLWNTLVPKEPQGKS